MTVCVIILKPAEIFDNYFTRYKRRKSLMLLLPLEHNAAATCNSHPDVTTAQYSVACSTMKKLIMQPRGYHVSCTICNVGTRGWVRSTIFLRFFNSALSLENLGKEYKKEKKIKGEKKWKQKEKKKANTKVSEPTVYV